MQLFPASCHFVSRGSNCSHQHPVLRLRSSVYVKYKVSQSYETTDQIIDLHILILTFQVAERKTKDIHLHVSKHSLIIMCS